jgi:hypothetical protein
LCPFSGSLFITLSKALRISSFGSTPENSAVHKSNSFVLPDFHIAQQFDVPSDGLRDAFVSLRAA